jgi:phage-related minor tail protein
MGTRTVKIEVIGDATAAKKELAEVEKTAQDTEAGLDKAGDDIGKTFDQMGKDAEKSGGVIANAFKSGFSFFAGGAALGMAADFGKGMINAVDQSMNSIGNLQAKLGLTGEDAKKLADVSKNVFKKGWGEDLNEVSDALIDVKRQFSDLNDTDLQNLTEQSLIIKQIFGVDTPESMKAASTMAKNFGITGTQALDLVTRGFQLGGDKAGDLLDTFNEYSVQFGTMGYSAKDFTNILISGLDNGAFNADKVADAVKEFNIRIRDGSTTTSDALKTLGIDTDDFNQKLASGAISGKDAMEMVNEKLRNMTDQTAQNNLGVALYGTQWEDVSSKVILGLDTAKDKVGNFDGATATAGQNVSNNLGAAWASFTRELMDKLAPVVSKVLEFAQMILPQIVAAFQWISQQVGPIIQTIVQWVTDLVNGLSGKLPTVDEFGKFIGNTFTTIQNVVKNVVDAVISVWNWLVDTLKPVFQALMDYITTGLLPTFSKISGFITEKIVPAFSDIWNYIQANILPILKGLADFIVSTLVVVFQNLGQIVSGVWQAIQGAIETVWSVISGIFKTIANVLRGDFSAAWKDIQDTVNGVWDGLGNIVGGAWDILRGIFKTIIDFITTTLNPVWKTIGDAVGKVADIIGGAFNAALGVIKGVINGVISAVNVLIDGYNIVGGIFGRTIPRIPMLAAGTNFFSGGLAIFGEAGAEIVSAGGVDYLATSPTLGYLPRGAKVTPVDQTQARNGAVVNITQHIYGLLPDEVEIQTRKAIRSEVTEAMYD